MSSMGQFGVGVPHLPVRSTAPCLSEGGEAYSRPCRLRLVIERGDYSTKCINDPDHPRDMEEPEVMVSSSRKTRFSLPPLKSVSGTCQWRRGLVHQPVHAAARTTVRVRFPFCVFCTAVYGTALFVPSVAGTFPSVSTQRSLWIICGGAGRTCRTYQGHRDGGCEQIANAHTTKKVSRCGRGTRNDQLYVQYTILGVLLHVAPIIYSTGKVREG